MKAIRFYLGVIWNFPTLIMHELAHAFVSFILGGGLSKITFEVSIDKNKIEGTCAGRRFLSKKDALVSWAPVIVPIITLALMFVNSEVFGLIFVYQLSTINLLMPSDQDLESAKKTLVDPFWSLTE